MNGADIARLIVTLAPIARDIVVEGGKVVANYRTDLTQDQINMALEASKSAGWPDLTFASPTINITNAPAV